MLVETESVVNLLVKSIPFFEKRWRWINIKEKEMIDELLKFNESFVAKKGYEKYITTKYPDKKIAIVTCMDTRLVELLPAALGLKNGDVKLIKNAGGTVMHPFGSVVRSLLVAIYELGVQEIMIIGHTDCGVQHMDSETMLQHMRERGISQDHIEMMPPFHIFESGTLINF